MAELRSGAPRRTSSTLSRSDGSFGSLGNDGATAAAAAVVGGPAGGRDTFAPSTDSGFEIVDPPEGSPTAACRTFTILVNRVECGCIDGFLQGLCLHPHTMLAFY